MALRRITLADLAPGNSNVAQIIMEGGRAQAEAAQRGGDAMANAISGITGTLAGGVQKFGQERQQKKVQDAVRLATASRYPSATKPVPGSATAVADPGTDHIQSILDRLSPEDRPLAMKGIQEIQAYSDKVQEHNLTVADLKGKLADAETKRKTVAADYGAGLGKQIGQWLNKPDGGLSAALFALGNAKALGTEGLEEVEPMLGSLSQEWEAAQASGDPAAIQAAAEKNRQAVGPFAERLTMGGSPEWQKSNRPETETMTTTNPDGSTRQEIVEKVPGVVRTSSPKPATVGSFDDYVIKKYGRSATPEQIAEARKVYGQADDRNPNSGGMGGLYGGIDPKAIAEAIQRGEQPPSITDLGRPVGAAVSSELAKSGYNLAKAQTDWKATQKHIATMNGAQQLRLNQAVNSLPDLLDSVDVLATQWKGGKFPVLNKANLALAKGGAYGSDVASVANKLDAQVADVVADLAVVYMGGNSPTDHGLQLASKSLSGDWDEKVLRDMVKMAKGNVTIRRNSILNTGVAGASADNPYAPPPAAAGGAARPRATNPQTGAVVEWDGSQWVPAK